MSLRTQEKYHFPFKWKITAQKLAFSLVIKEGQKLALKKKKKKKKLSAYIPTQGNSVT